ncbi:hypothetical protein [Burkholderia ubonensis]|uniref:hypothetical protein n=1 Tax=Burkholderia ubonensis TaxID=101571 RepID=UPI000A537BEE
MKHIALVAFDQFTDIDLFLMWDILGRNRDDWQVRIVGNHDVLRSAHGLPVNPHGTLATRTTPMSCCSRAAGRACRQRSRTSRSSTHSGSTRIVS